MVDRARLVYPFPAIVGQDKAKLALLIAAVNPSVGGVLLRGDKGTGKSTMVRALADVLPEVKVVRDCPFSCDPDDPRYMCDRCYERYRRGEELPVAYRKMRVVDLPLSVSIERLVGTINIEKFLREGVVEFKPGILAEANRNILYIDEVNLLDDYIVDTLLDVAASGWNIVEREGVSVRHPARFILVGSMNPEEGELRPQLLDRFGLVVTVEAPLDPDVRSEIVRRVEEWQEDPESFYRKYEPEIERLRERIKKAREILQKVTIDEDLLKLLAKTVVELGIRTSRAEITTVRAAKAIAALDGRTKVTLEDLKKAMELTLPHRMRQRPFQQPEQNPFREDNRESTSRVENRANRPDNKNVLDIENKGRKGRDKEEVVKSQNVDNIDNDSYTKSRNTHTNVITIQRSRRTEIRKLGSSEQGLVLDSVPLQDVYREHVDIYSTIKNYVLTCRRTGPPVPLHVLRTCLKSCRTRSLNIILLDLSGSMNFMRRIAIAKGIVKNLAERSYVDRCYISLITFRKDRATVLVEPTRRIETVYNVVDTLESGGATPLAHALERALIITKSWLRKYRKTNINIHIITDGKCNVSLFNKPIEDSLKILEELVKLGANITIYDTRIRSRISVAPSIIDKLESSPLDRVRILRI
ncbi:MAG: VWA domain-containing protein [Crenarchaeota archaeon]|nr:VWA domain-containing protein [Thermoproteota archaeon]